MRAIFAALVVVALGGVLLPAVEAESVGKPVIGGPVSPDGKCEVTCDLPAALRHHNEVGTDGAGLCVFASADHAALWQNDAATIGLFQKMRRERGGGWPEKFDSMMRKYSKGARYVQYQGTDPAVLELALKTGRMPCITYTPAHMVNLVYLGQEWAAVLDNNAVGVHEIRWFKRAELLRLWTMGGNGWAIVLLAPRPPLPPRNFNGGK